MSQFYFAEAHLFKLPWTDIVCFPLFFFLSEEKQFPRCTLELDWEEYLFQESPANFEAISLMLTKVLTGLPEYIVLIGVILGTLDKFFLIV